MGLTCVDGVVRSSLQSTDARTVRCLVDSGATLTLVPRADLEALGIAPGWQESFELADGSTITREVASAHLSINGRQTVSPVVVGEEGDEPLLGVVALESMGLAFDPLSRRVAPRPHRLGSMQCNGVAVAHTPYPAYT